RGQKTRPPNRRTGGLPGSDRAPGADAEPALCRGIKVAPIPWSRGPYITGPSPNEILFYRAAVEVRSAGHGFEGAMPLMQQGAVTERWRLCSFVAPRHRSNLTQRRYRKFFVTVLVERQPPDPARTQEMRRFGFTGPGSDSEPLLHTFEERGFPGLKTDA